MQLLQLEHVSKSFGPLEVLADVSFGVNRGERVAIVAPNGAGKTTLLRIIAGQLMPDAGRVTWARGAGAVGYLPQAIPPGLAPTAGDSLTAAAAAGHRPGEEDRIDEAGRIAEALRRFGLPPACLTSGLDQLSGGERTRCLLAGLWLQSADFLLLDEPTNHLDMAGLRWLEQWVAGYRGTVLMVSHDRVFLDRAATRVIALDGGRARSYPGNYSDYRQARATEVESQLQQYRAEERRVAALREAVIRQAGWAEQSHKNAARKGDSRAAWVYYRNKAEKIAQRGKALSSQLERLEAARTEAPRQAPSFQMRLQHADKTGRFVLRVEGVDKSFDRPLLSNITFAVGRGEKVGLVGPNGSGKTTLLRIIAGQLPPDSGRVHQLPGSGATYLDQHASSLRNDLTPHDEILRLVGQPATARTLLGSFLFDEHRALARIATLSPGERSRLALLIMLLSPSNLLLLDEPTNHLDLPSREQVETALATYGGAILLVSHDRYLLQTLCSRIVALDGHGMRSYPGGYAEYEASAGPAELGHAPERVVLTNQGRPSGDDETRIVLENRLAVLSGELARLTKDDPAYAAAVEEFLVTARRLRRD